jgi:hypothetical protein
MDYVYLVIVLALIEYIVLGALVGRARGKYGVKAPAVTGHEAAALGLVGIVARALYAFAYIRAPASRGPSAVVLAVVNIALLVGSLVALARAII